MSVSWCKSLAAASSLLELLLLELLALLCELFAAAPADRFESPASAFARGFACADEEDEDEAEALSSTSIASLLLLRPLEPKLLLSERFIPLPLLPLLDELLMVRCGAFAGDAYCGRRCKNTETR